jgi:hypothetical protein
MNKNKHFIVAIILAIYCGYCYSQTKITDDDFTKFIRQYKIDLNNGKDNIPGFEIKDIVLSENIKIKDNKNNIDFVFKKITKLKSDGHTPEDKACAILMICKNHKDGCITYCIDNIYCIPAVNNDEEIWAYAINQISVNPNPVYTWALLKFIAETTNKW